MPTQFQNLFNQLQAKVTEVIACATDTNAIKGLAQLALDAINANKTASAAALQAMLDNSVIESVISQKVGEAKKIIHTINMEGWDDSKFYPIIISGSVNRSQMITLERFYAKGAYPSSMSCFLRLRVLSGSWGGNPNGAEIIGYRYAYRKAIAKVGYTGKATKTVIYARGGYSYDLSVDSVSTVNFYQNRTEVVAGVFVDAITSVDAILNSSITTNLQTQVANQ